MLTLLQITKAVNDKIKSALTGTAFSAVQIVASDVSEPIIRPSIKVMLEDSSNGKFNAQCREKTLTFRVYFFAQNINKYRIDNLKMQDIIENAFLDGLYVDGAYIPTDSVESEVVDTVLICSFDIYTIELLPDTDTSEIIEELNFKEVTND